MLLEVPAGTYTRKRFVLHGKRAAQKGWERDRQWPTVHAGRHGSSPARNRSDAGRSRCSHRWSRGRGCACRTAASGDSNRQFANPPRDVARRIDSTLHTGGIPERMRRSPIKDQTHTEYFSPAAGPERPAKEIREYVPAVVPGLLQTREDARTMFPAGNPSAADEHIGEPVKERPDRAQVLGAPQGPCTGWRCTRRCRAPLRAGRRSRPTGSAAPRP
ncbi:Scr1 family TA system antitoxin-like transcriptional regulator [Streptomyces sp. NPDC007000]|uniref:Scr1 family TA system antitoxin-like transcriptional regulator n=2 Tax=unclassified Streptomyces TaxID=2593676 RepID=UPI0033FDEA72